MSLMQDNRFTIYDAMDKKGVFRNNPANASSPKYEGPVKYPKMLYHPKGLEKVTNPGEIIETPLGAKVINVQREMISIIVENAADDKQAQALGWHDHPAKAIAASGKLAPPMGSEQGVDDIDRAIARLEEQKAMMLENNNIIARANVGKAAPDTTNSLLNGLGQKQPEITNAVAPAAGVGTMTLASLKQPGQ